MDYDIAEKKINEIISTNNNVLQNAINFLYENFEKYSWMGIYIVDGENLILGPWRGKNATEHTKIPIGEGICGSAAASGKTELIPDVNKDKRYLSCFISTKSEIVIPIKKDNKIVGELDIDSDVVDAFTEKDRVFLEKVADMLSMHIR